MVDRIQVSENDQPLARFDLDGSGRVENVLGGLWTTLQQNLDADFDLAIEASLEEPELAWIVSVDVCATNDSYSRVSLRRGSLEPGGTIQLPSDDYIPSVGRLQSGSYVTADGVGEVPISILFDLQPENEPGWAQANAIAADLQTMNGEVYGWLGFALEETIGYESLAGPLARSLTYLIEADPGCPERCENEWLDLVLEDYGPSIEPTELIESPNHLYIIGWRPDTDLLAEHDGEMVYWPGHDEVFDHMAMTLRIHAHEVQVAP